MLGCLLLSLQVRPQGALAVEQPITMDFVNASAAVFAKNDKAFPAYSYLNHLEVAGFKVAVYDSNDERYRIIAFRGSQNLKNWIFDATHIGHRSAVGKAPALLAKIAVAVTVGLYLPLLWGQVEGVSLGVSLGGMVATYLANPDGYKTLEKMGTQRLFQAAKKALARFVEDNLDTSRDVYVTGHSLGGFLAQYYASKYLLPGRSFNAPALKDYDLEHRLSEAEYFEKGGVFINHKLKGDLISQSSPGAHLGPLIIHDHDFWQRFPSVQIISYQTRLHSIEWVVDHFKEHQNSESC